MKAFDTVPHRRLLAKIENFGIKGEIYYWIRDFLTNRSQHVNVNNEQSSLVDVLSGVPQGSVLGPLLFLIYINDLPDNLCSESYMFADDTKIFRRILSKLDQDAFQSDIEKLTLWSEKWLLKFHPEKCKVMTLCNNGNKLQYNYTMSNIDNRE